MRGLSVTCSIPGPGWSRGHFWDACNVRGSGASGDHPGGLVLTLVRGPVYHSGGCCSVFPRSPG